MPHRPISEEQAAIDNFLKHWGANKTSAPISSSGGASSLSTVAKRGGSQFSDIAAPFTMPSINESSLRMVASSTGRAPINLSTIQTGSERDAKMQTRAQDDQYKSDYENAPTAQQAMSESEYIESRRREAVAPIHHDEAESNTRLLHQLSTPPQQLQLENSLEQRDKDAQGQFGISDIPNIIANTVVQGASAMNVLPGIMNTISPGSYESLLRATEPYSNIGKKAASIVGGGAKTLAELALTKRALGSGLEDMTEQEQGATIFGLQTQLANVIPVIRGEKSADNVNKEALLNATLGGIFPSAAEGAESIVKPFVENAPSLVRGVVNKVSQGVAGATVGIGATAAGAVMNNESPTDSQVTESALTMAAYSLLGHHSDRMVEAMGDLSPEGQTEIRDTYAKNYEAHNGDAEKAAYSTARELHDEENPDHGASPDRFAKNTVKNFRLATGEPVREENEKNAQNTEPTTEQNAGTTGEPAVAPMGEQGGAETETNAPQDGMTVFHGTSNENADALTEKFNILSPEEKLKLASTGGGNVGLSGSSDPSEAQKYADALGGKTVEIKLSSDANILQVDTGGYGIDEHYTGDQLSDLSKQYDAIHDISKGAGDEVRILRPDKVIQSTGETPPQETEPIASESQGAEQPPQGQEGQPLKRNPYINKKYAQEVADNPQTPEQAALAFFHEGGSIEPESYNKHISPRLKSKTFRNDGKKKSAEQVLHEKNRIVTKGGMTVDAAGEYIESQYPTAFGQTEDSLPVDFELNGGRDAIINAVTNHNNRTSMRRAMADQHPEVRMAEAQDAMYKKMVEIDSDHAEAIKNVVAAPDGQVSDETLQVMEPYFNEESGDYDWERYSNDSALSPSHENYKPELFDARAEIENLRQAHGLVEGTQTEDFNFGNDVSRQTSEQPEEPEVIPGSQTDSGALPAQPETSGIKNTTNESERSERGLPTSEPVETRPADVAWEAARNRYESPGGRSEAMRLVKEITDNPKRGINEEELDLLEFERSERLKEVDAAREEADGAVSDDAKNKAEDRLDAARESFDEASAAAKTVGTEQARAFRARQNRHTENMTLTEMEQEARTAINYGKSVAEKRPLDQDELTDIKQKYEEIEKARAEVNRRSAELDERDSKQQGEGEFQKLLKEVLKDKRKPTLTGQKLRDYGTKLEAEGRTEWEAYLKASQGQLHAGIDASALKPLVKLGVGKLTRGLGDFADWSDAMLKDIGENIRPHLGFIFSESKKDLLSATFGGKTTSDILNEHEGSPLSKKFVRDLIRSHVERGDNDFTSVMGKVHAEVSQAHPEVTERSVRDTFSDYGKVKLPSDNPVNKKLADFKQIGILTSKIEDATGGKVPLKTGFSRGEISDEARGLIGKLNELLRDNKLSQVDPERQIKNQLDRVKTIRKNSIRDLEKQKAQGEFTQRERARIIPDAELEDLNAKYKKLVRERDDYFDKIRWQNEPFGQKALNKLVSYYQGAVISSPLTMERLLTAGIVREAYITPVENIESGIIQGVTGKLGEKNFLRQVFNEKTSRDRSLQNFFSDEKAALTAMAKYGFGDALKSAKLQYSDIEELYSEKKLRTPTKGEIVGFLHNAIKAPVVRAEMTMSYIQRMRRNEQLGHDITDKALQTQTMRLAFKDGLRAKFQQENILSKGFNIAVNYFENNKLAPGTGRALAAFLKFNLPVVNIPVNIAAEGAEYIHGIFTGIGRLAYAYKKGMESLTAEEADHINRLLVRGIHGAGLGAVALVGFNNHKKVNDFLDRNPWGKLLMHTPPAMAFKFFSKAGENYENSKNLVSSTTGAFLDLAQHVPFITTMNTLGAALKPSKDGTPSPFFQSYFGNILRNFIPMAAQDVAKRNDTDNLGEPIKRKPGNLLEQIEMGIPGMRQNVPLNEKAIKKDKDKKLLDDLRNDKQKGMEELRQAKLRGELSKEQAKRIVSESKLTEYQDKFNKKGLEDAIKFYKEAEPQDRRQLDKLLPKKYHNAMKKGEVAPKDRARLRQQYKETISMR